ncbi:ubiquitin conjugating enzyme Ubc7/UbcP3 [Tilletia horrida]|nr:ubiquitin conjugating enzyme Ubc7/UbcP3 [Tilletia horrida]
MNSRTSYSAAVKRLAIEYKQLSSDPDGLFPAVGPISEDNYLEWEALLPGPEDTPFEGGVFSAKLSFLYPDGLVCISILHAAGDDPNMYESASERWSPVQSVQPNVESGANIDACKMYRDDPKGYERTIRDQVRQQLGL